MEYLANELFLEIFQYCDARDIFHAFYGLNTRFNHLLESLSDLSLVFIRIHSRKRLHRSIHPHCVQTLTIDRFVNIRLQDYSNVRHLKFFSPTREQFDQLESIHLPHLEHLHISTNASDHFHLDLFDRYNPGYKIFANGFPNLQSCSLLHIDLTFMVTEMIQSIQLRFLRLGFLSLKSYQGVLRVCPNLCFLRFNFPRLGGKPLPKTAHVNLYRLVIDLEGEQITFGEYDLKEYLSCLPNLTRLSIYQNRITTDLKSFLRSNWFVKSLPEQILPTLRFRYYLFIGSLDQLDENNDDILNLLESNFDHAHGHRGQSKLIFRLHS